MARKRVIDPSFFTDGELADLPAWLRLFYIGLWTEAEDSGCFDGDARTLWKRLVAGEVITCPDCGKAHSLTPQDVENALGVLEGLGKVQPYQVQGNGAGLRRYYWLVNFGKWQRIDYPTPPKLPLPDFIIWHGESEYAEGNKGEEGYRPNRRRWHYAIM